MSQHLKQRLLGAAVLMVFAAIFLPVIFDGAGYRQLSKIELGIPEETRISFEQDFPELYEKNSQVVIARKQVDVGDLSADKRWFVHVADYGNMEAAANLVKRLTTGGYKASYKMVSKEGDTTFRVEVRAGDNKSDAQGVSMRLGRDYGFKTSLVQR